MDKAERDDLRAHMATVARIYEPGFCPRISQHEIMALLAAADERDLARRERDLARRERDVARAWAKRYREALEMIESGVRSEHEIVDLRWCGAVAGNALTTCDVEEQ